MLAKCPPCKYWLNVRWLNVWILLAKCPPLQILAKCPLAKCPLAKCLDTVLCVPSDEDKQTVINIKYIVRVHYHVYVFLYTCVYVFVSSTNSLTKVEDKQTLAHSRFRLPKKCNQTF